MYRNDDSRISESDYRSYSFGGLVTFFRSRASMTQEELGEYVDRRRNAIIEWEKGKRKPKKRAVVIKLAECLDLGPRDTDLLLHSAGFKPEHNRQVIALKDLQPLPNQKVMEGMAATPEVFGYLRIADETDRDKVIPLQGEWVRIGRDPAKNDILAPVTYTLVSGEHAAIYKTADGVFVADLKSTNGTYVDGFRVVEPTRLEAGQYIVLGAHTLQPRVRAYEFLSDPGPTEPRYPG